MSNYRVRFEKIGNSDEVYIVDEIGRLLCRVDEVDFRANYTTIISDEFGEDYIYYEIDKNILKHISIEYYLK